AAWWLARACETSGTVQEGVASTACWSVPLVAPWVLRQDGGAGPAAPAGLRREVAAALRRVREGHEGAPPRLPAEREPEDEEPVGDRPAGPVVPERFAVLQSLLAYLLARCGDESQA